MGELKQLVAAIIRAETLRALNIKKKYDELNGQLHMHKQQGALVRLVTKSPKLQTRDYGYAYQFIMELLLEFQTLFFSIDNNPTPEQEQMLQSLQTIKHLPVNNLESQSEYHKFILDCCTHSPIVQKVIQTTLPEAEVIL